MEPKCARYLPFPLSARIGDYSGLHKYPYEPDAPDTDVYPGHKPGDATLFRPGSRAEVTAAATLIRLFPEFMSFRHETQEEDPASVS